MIDDEKAFQQIQDEIWRLRCRISGFIVADSLALETIVEHLEDAEDKAWRAEKEAQFTRQSKELSEKVEEEKYLDHLSGIKGVA